MNTQAPHYYSRDEWAAMTADERIANLDERLRVVEAAHAEHEARKRLADELTAERFRREREWDL